LNDLQTLHYYTASVITTSTILPASTYLAYMYYPVDCSGGPVTITLPATGSAGNSMAWFVKTDNTPNALTLAEPSGNIVGTTSVSAQGNMLMAINNTQGSVLKWMSAKLA
jgi:hypothetical protein